MAKTLGKTTQACHILFHIFIPLPKFFFRSSTVYQRKNGDCLLKLQCLSARYLSSNLCTLPINQSTASVLDWVIGIFSLFSLIVGIIRIYQNYCLILWYIFVNFKDKMIQLLWSSLYDEHSLCIVYKIVFKF